MFKRTPTSAVMTAPCSISAHSPVWQRSSVWCSVALYRQRSSLYLQFVGRSWLAVPPENHRGRLALLNPTKWYCRRMALGLQCREAITYCLQVPAGKIKTSSSLSSRGTWWLDINQTTAQVKAQPGGAGAHTGPQILGRCSHYTGQKGVQASRGQTTGPGHPCGPSSGGSGRCRMEE